MNTPTTVWRHVNDQSHMLFAFYEVELDGEVSEEAVWMELRPGVDLLEESDVPSPDPAEWVELVPESPLCGECGGDHHDSVDRTPREQARAARAAVTLPAYYGANLPKETEVKHGRGYFRVELDGSVRYWNPVLSAVTPTEVTVERIWNHPQRYPRVHSVPPQVSEAFQL